MRLSLFTVNGARLNVVHIPGRLFLQLFRSGGGAWGAGDMLEAELTPEHRDALVRVLQSEPPEAT